MLKLLQTFFIIRHGLGDEGPEGGRMIELADMAKFVDDDIVCKRFGQQRETITKIQIPLFRTRTPAGFLIFDSDLSVCEFIMLIKILESAKHELARFFFVQQIFAATWLAAGDFGAPRNSPARGFANASHNFSVSNYKCKKTHRLNYNLPNAAVEF